MRAFIAVNLDGKVKEALASKLLGLAKAGPGVKWVEPKNLHMTLKFLGNIDGEQAGKAKEIVDSAASGSKMFELEVLGWGSFPEGKHPRVIWAGIGQGGKELTALAENIENGCSRAGFVKEEKRFVPHLTVGRVRDGKGIGGVIKALSDLGDGKIGGCPVRSVDLMESVLGGKEPEYRIIHSAKLGI